MSQRLERSVAHRVVWRGQRREVGPINGVPVMGVFTGQNPHFDVTATGIARFPIKSRHRPGRVPLQAIRAVLASSACAESVEEITATHFHCVETCHPTQKPSNCACPKCSKPLLASCILVCPEKPQQQGLQLVISLCFLNRTREVARGEQREESASVPPCPG